MEEVKVKFPLRSKIYILVLTASIPFMALLVYVLVAFVNYSDAYGTVVSNMAIANNYNFNFKEEMDESIYRLAAESTTFETIDDDPSLKSPYKLIDELRNEGSELMKITIDSESRRWLQSMLTNLDTLEARIGDIKHNLDEGGHYEENMEMLDNNIYILTDLIQDDIQYYIFYQTKNIEQLKIALNSQVFAFRTFIIFLTIALILVVLITSRYVINNITKPVIELSIATKSIAKGNFEKRVGVLATKDEVALLAESTNDMARHLQVMVDKIKEDERKMRYAELRLLQEQINPHFLYNTLETIIWLIECEKNEDAVNMLVSLSEFFRIVLSKGREYITIKEEENHVNSYLAIQQVRYRDILDYSINIDSEIYDYKILKLTLQPLIENSLYHGIKYKRAKGIIEITGHKDGSNIILTVRDTGVGMDEETLSRLREEISRPCKETESGFGIANVNERIKMNFGTEYGISIESELGVGTTVTVVIPATLAEKPQERVIEKDQVQKDDREDVKPQE